MGDSDLVRKTDNVYALGFLSGTDDDVFYHTKDDINIQFGVISKKTDRRRCEMGKMNYCITDNTTVGCVHAVIVKKGADYAIIDQKSTNGTFVNNVRLTPGQERFLKDGDTLKLSDEILEFVVK